MPAVVGKAMTSRAGRVPGCCRGSLHRGFAIDNEQLDALITKEKSQRRVSCVAWAGHRVDRHVDCPSCRPEARKTYELQRRHLDA
jgi:hypothetical protein